MKRTIVSLLFLIGFSALMYGLTLRGVAGNPSVATIQNELTAQTNPFELSPERGRYTLLLALAEHGSFELPEDIALLAMPDVGYLNGKFFAIFNPGLSIIALPFYYLGKIFGYSQLATFTVPAIFATFNSIMIFFIARHFKATRWAAVTAALVFAFSTTSWAYAVTLYQHHVTVFFILVMFYSLTALRHRPFLAYSLTWLCYGIALTVDSPNPILLLPLVLYMLFNSIEFKKNRRFSTISFDFKVVFSGIFFAIIVALFGYHNYLNFGSFTKLPGTMPRYKDIVELEGIRTVEDLTNNKTALGLFDARRLDNGMFTLLASDDRGIFLYAPVALIGLLGLIAVRKEYANEVATVISIIGVNIVLYGSFGDPWGGWAFGPRYLIPTMALLSVFIGVALTYFNKYWIRFLVIGAAMYSSAVTLLGVLTTNAVPPKIEAIHLPIKKYNFLLNADYIKDNRSSSFVYNFFFSDTLSVGEYYSLLLMILFLTLGVIVLMIPLFDKERSVV